MKFGNLVPEWMKQGFIRPYVLTNREHKVRAPGTLYSFEWFDKKPIVKDAFKVSELEFANQVMKLDSLAFGSTDMVTPRWVFYDCAVVPGLITGFAIERSRLPEALEKKMNPPVDLDWVPLSLFIVIPTIKPGYWAAHNLGSVNELLPKDQRFSGLGFLSKAFGLWYGNIKRLYGVTQWGKPALRLHANYGDLELVTAYTPVHTYAHTLTYKLGVDTNRWFDFFSDQPSQDTFLAEYSTTGLKIDPSSVESAKQIQSLLEEGRGPFFLNGYEVLTKDLNQPLEIYKPNLKSAKS